MKKWFLGMEDELVMVKQLDSGYETAVRLQGTQPVALVQDPRQQARIYCGTYGHGLWISEDFGETWSAIGKSNLYHGRIKGKGIRSPYITALAVNPQNGRVYAGTEPSALFYSADQGRNWTEFEGIQNLPSQPNWQFPPRPHTSHVRWIAPSYANEMQLNVSIEFGAFISTSDHGNTWQDRPFMSPLDTHTLLAHPQEPGKLFAACGDGLRNPDMAYAESDDEGHSWHFLSEGLERHPYLYSLAMHPDDLTYRLVSAAENAAKAHHDSLYTTVYLRNDDASWEEVADGLPCIGAFIHTLTADSSGVFYALNNFGLFQLDGDGGCWEKMNINWKRKYLQQHPSCLIAVEQ